MASVTRKRRWSQLPYAASWIVGGLIAVTVSIVAFGWPQPSPLALGMLAVTTAAESAEVHFASRRTRGSYTLIESALVADLLLLPASTALCVALIGLSAAQLLRRRQPTKVAFNSGQVAVATLAALVIYQVVAGPDDGGPYTLLRISAAIAGMGAYTLVNLTAMSGLVARVANTSAWEIAQLHGVRIVATVLGNATVGALAAAQLRTSPQLLPLLAVPIAAVHLSSRASIRTMALVQEVRAEHDRLQGVVQAASDGIVLLDAEGRIQLWNPAMQTATQRDARSAIGHDARRELTPDETSLLAPDDTSGPSTREVTLHRPDGGTATLMAFHTPLFGERPGREGTVIVVHDVTRQREADALKGNFVARVSHELRTPLAPIRGLAQALIDHPDRVDRDRQQRALGQIVERADHMARLVEDLLLVSRVTRDRDDHDIDIDLASMPITPLVEQAVSWFRAEHPDRTVTTSISGNPTVLADNTRLLQIVTNLLGNAGKYTPVQTPIEVNVETVADTIQIRVIDHGPGIPPDKRETIFEPFHRLEDPLTMRTGGVGLGLYLARRFATAMGGQLHAHEAEAGGAAFVLALPLAAPALAHAAA